MLYWETKIHVGGLLRCCIVTVEQFISDYGYKPAEQGAVVECPYCHTSVRLDEGIWRWVS